MGHLLPFSKWGWGAMGVEPPLSLADREADSLLLLENKTLSISFLV